MAVETEDLAGTRELREGAPGRGEAVPADERGALSIDDRVVRRIAEAASLSVRGTVRHASLMQRVAGATYPRVSVRTLGRRADVTLDVAVGWPSPVSDLAAQVRDAVHDAVEKQTGMTVARVDVTVHVVPASEADQPRRVR